MSLYRFIASDNPLVEVDYSGFIKMRVKDIKEMEPTPPPPASLDSWDEMDDETTILYAEDESKLGGLTISICDDPPYNLEKFINKKYIYWLEGDFSKRFLKQLTEYVKVNIKEKDSAALWSIWFGNEIKSKQVKSVKHSDVSIDNFEILKDHECCCVKIK